MKIVIVSRKLNSRQSAPKCSFYLASELAKLGQEVHVLACAITPEANTKLRGSKVVIHRTPEFFAKRQLSPLLYTLADFRLKKLFCADIVFGNGYTLFDDFTWIHLPRLATMARLGISYRRLYAGILFEKLQFRTSKMLVAPSSLVSRDLQDFYGVPKSKIVVQPHGVDIEYYQPIAPSEKRNLSPEGKTTILFVGGSPLRKGFHLLLKSLSLVKDHSNLKLIAVGFKPSTSLEFLVGRLGLRNEVSFEGFVSTKRLKELYQQSDMYVLPSLYDPFSIATLEAMASGLTSIVSPYTGITDILHNWYDAIVVNPLDKIRFAEVLSTLIHDDGLRREVGFNGLKTARNYSWQNVAKNMIELFNHIQVKSKRF